MPKYPQKEIAQLVLQQCVVNNIENVVISPGSRNAPLTIGFVNHASISALSVVDERSAAFFALGIAQQTKKPVAVLCSSGSALLNYYPAVAEAFYSNIPLVVISADRPKYLIDIGDGQTIRQEGVFDNHILFNANLTESNTELLHNSKLIEKALRLACEHKGPVHINIAFEEPLYETVDHLIPFPFNIVGVQSEISANSLLDEVPLEVDELQKFADIWNVSSKKMILLGENFPDTLTQTQLSHIINDPSVLVLTETTSNVYHKNFINNIDQLIFSLDEEKYKDLQPDVLLTFGGMVVSKKIKQFLRKHQPKHHWHVGNKVAYNTYFCLRHHFKISSQLFFSQFFFLTKAKESDYQNTWLLVKKNRKKRHELYINKVQFSDLKVFDSVLKQIPKNSLLQLANSSIIRYSQLFDIDKSLQIFCNRGASGIDGSTSTAIGASWAQTKPTIFITGDISFFYDSNALWNNYIKSNFRIILINNSGGGIFRFIPGPQKSDALEYFETPHGLNAFNLCEMYGFDYFKAKNNEELKAHLNIFYKPSKRPGLLEIFTPPLKNDKVLKNYFKNLIETVDIE
ncbi:MAG: 2-succinyl-5-enolpyruvyl-6-hydroxy-3-cyclohexene-1-carboxylic-acid synthase [Flavobacteriaceae bacterium]|nr:2-succinyl-5-enolpyruvyl-6-hydroxy-3-cyclohexene-1-carboxylic-acid synthase [Flavobacteriaceae bacterium]